MTGLLDNIPEITCVMSCFALGVSAWLFFQCVLDVKAVQSAEGVPNHRVLLVIAQHAGFSELVRMIVVACVAYVAWLSVGQPLQERTHWVTYVLWTVVVAGYFINSILGWRMRHKVAELS